MLAPIPKDYWRIERKVPMTKTSWFLIITVLVIALSGVRCGQGPAVVISSIPGTGTISGEVEAPGPFQAAQVYAMNVDKDILYMVYTAGGHYRAVNLLPGNYEMTARKKGFTADVQRITIEAGQNAIVDLSMREADPETVLKDSYVGSRTIREDLQFASFDELYPPGPGRDLALDTCVYCHGPGFAPQKQWNEAQWMAGIDRMTNPDAPVGAIVPPDKLSPQDKVVLAAYLAKNFGPDSPKRALRLDVEMPLDEAALAKAMYIEYYLPVDEETPKRVGQDPHLDSDGNVWFTDRSIPNRLGRLDPRTGEITDYELPDPRADPHGLTVDAEGHVWWAETRGLHLGRLEPRTGEMVRYSMDPNGEIEGGQGHTPIVDSEQNIWFTVIIGNKLGKWDRKTEKITLWEVPTPNSYPYGIVLDKDENIWIAEFVGCKVAKFDRATEKFTEYTPLTEPCLMRRLGIDSKGTIWYGLFSSGKLGKLDPNTGEIIEYDLPMPHSQPYDTWADAEDNIWIGDGGQSGTLIKFDPLTEKFTYYPAPQRGDMPKLEVTQDGAIWYNPRSADRGAVGVLYPDVSKMTSFAAYDYYKF